MHTKTLCLQPALLSAMQADTRMILRRRHLQLWDLRVNNPKCSGARTRWGFMRRPLRRRAVVQNILYRCVSSSGSPSRLPGITY